jgi:ribonuclease P protein component
LPLLKPSIIILSGFGSFTRIITHGKKYESSPIRAFVYSSPSNQIQLCVGFAVTRRIRKAVQRNLLKRLMKEAFRSKKEDFLSCIDTGMMMEIVFLYNAETKSPSKQVNFTFINQAMTNLFSTINTSCHQVKI